MPQTVELALPLQPVAPLLPEVLLRYHSLPAHCLLTLVTAERRDVPSSYSSNYVSTLAVRGARNGDQGRCVPPPGSHPGVKHVGA